MKVVKANDINLEVASLEDMKEILDLQKQAYISEAKIYENYNIPPLLQTIDEIKQEYHMSVFLKAVKNNIIIGSVRANKVEDTVFIGRLIVKDEYQNKGVGSLLLRSIEQYFKGVKRFELFTGYKSIKNMYLYQKHGYHEFKRLSSEGSPVMIFLEKNVI